MLLFLLAYLGGALTILSPCILPVLPFVFARAGQPFVRSTLPLLAGMVLMFAVVASLAAVGGSWVVAANQYGRWLALVAVALFGLALLLPGVAERLTRPLVSVGGKLSERASTPGGEARPGASFMLGIATGLLWAPCAGPILGLVLTGAALQGFNFSSTLLLLAYAAGAATSLAAALLLGGKVFAAMKRSLGIGEWVRRGLGAAMLIGAAAIALGLDTGVLAQISTASTGNIEQALVDRLATSENDTPEQPAMAESAPTQAAPAMMQDQAPSQDQAPQQEQTSQQEQSPAATTTVNEPVKRPAGVPSGLPDKCAAPSLDGAVQWLNSPPLTLQALRGKVVLVDFWTYSCINCLRALPYVKAWSEKYRDQGLVVIGVHAPEFAFERDIGNVTRAMRKLGITYPVAIDNKFAIWRAYRNHYWPAHYFIDAQGRIRHSHFGEGEYDESERVIQKLLREAGSTVDNNLSRVDGSGMQMASAEDAVASFETYLGYERAENFASGEMVHDRASTYALPAQLARNRWGLEGEWNIAAERATLAGASGKISFRFRARDLHLVLGPGRDGKPVRFRITIDGAAPGEARGMDVDADGTGSVTEQRLYQLVRQAGDVAERTFSIEFLDPGVSAYAFTFG